MGGERSRRERPIVVIGEAERSDEIAKELTGGVERETYTIAILVYAGRDDRVIAFAEWPSTQTKLQSHKEFTALWKEGNTI